MYSVLTIPENTYIVVLVWDPLVILIVTFVSFAIFFSFSCDPVLGKEDLHLI